MLRKIFELFHHNLEGNWGCHLDNLSQPRKIIIPAGQTATGNNNTADFGLN